MAELHIETQVVGGVPTIYLRGELDSYSAPRVHHLLETMMCSERPALLLDLTRLEYIDSVGLGVLVAGLKQATDHSGMLALVNPSPSVARVLRITGLDKVFAVYSEPAQAQESLRSLSPDEGG